MAHATHVIVVQAEDGQAAIERAWAATKAWGDVDNDKEVLVAISPSGERVNPEVVQMRHSRDVSKYTVDEVNGWIQSRISHLLDPQGMAAGTGPVSLMEVVAREGVGALDGVQCYVLAKHFGALSDAMCLFHEGVSEFNLFSHQFRPWQLDETGVTHLEWDGEAKDGAWAVLIDIHSS